MLEENMDKLRRITEEVKKQETLTGEQVKILLSSKIKISEVGDFNFGAGGET